MGVPRRAALIVSLCLSAGVVAAVAATTGTEPGPIRAGTHTTEQAFDVAVSHEAWDGIVRVKNSGKEVAILDSVRLVKRSPGLRFLGAYTHRKRDPYEVSNAGGRGWPPPAGARPYRVLEGTRVPPARTLEDGTKDIQVIIRVQAPAEPARVSYDAVKINYHVGDKHYSVRMKHSLVLCARPKGQPVICE